MAASYSISGTSGPVIVPNSAAWELSDWSWSYWIKIVGSPSSTAVMSTVLTGGSPGSGVDTEVFGGDLYAELQANQHKFLFPSDGAWHHIVYAYAFAGFDIYVDGALFGNFFRGNMSWSGDDLRIAGFGTATCRIKGARIYNRRLSSGDVATLATGGELPLGLIFHWRMNEGSGTTITDDVGGLVGTAAGGIDWSTDVPAQNPDPPPALAAGAVSFTSSGPGGITCGATSATGGTSPYTEQWQRSDDGGATYADLTDGGGVTGATTLTLFDGSAEAGTRYFYRAVFTDSAETPATVTSNAADAQVYPGGPLATGGSNASGQRRRGR